ncbi:hypothetical protein [Streptomyces ipomoeae]|nr:hypothetical protein [Streptomyces ipomoeae]MDX2694246.1 hypothetical protein [Streptomyces ipomoeae]MDX2839843.1 hypothetical protein [Streptomyces ipomoeae]
MPSYVRRAQADSPWPRPTAWPGLLAALVRSCLPLAIVLCAFLHGPIDEATHPLTATVPAVALSSPGDEPPHGPHGHHAAEECVPAGVVLRAPAVRTTDQPSTAATTPLLAGVAAFAVCPPRWGRRRPHRCRRSRTGRSALVRTSRWRI